MANTYDSYMKEFPYEWDEDRIRFEFDNDWGMTIEKLVDITGRDRYEIKEILLDRK